MLQGQYEGARGALQRKRRMGSSRAWSWRPAASSTMWRSKPTASSSRRTSSRQPTQHGQQITQLVENFYNEARVSTEHYSRLHVCYQDVLVTVSNLTYKLVMARCAGFATVFSGAPNIQHRFQY